MQFDLFCKSLFKLSADSMVFLTIEKNEVLTENNFAGGKRFFVRSFI